MRIKKKLYFIFNSKLSLNEDLTDLNVNTEHSLSVIFTCRNQCSHKKSNSQLDIKLLV